MVIICCVQLVMSFSLDLVIIMCDYSQESRPYLFEKNELGSTEEKRRSDLYVGCYKYTVLVPKRLRKVCLCCSVKTDISTCVLLIDLIYMLISEHEALSIHLERSIISMAVKTSLERGTSQWFFFLLLTIHLWNKHSCLYSYVFPGVAQDFS